MQDTYNLCWKISLVVKKLAKRSILKTYQSDKRHVAQDLIAFVYRFSRLFSGRPAKDAANKVGISIAEFKDAFKKGAIFASGLAVDYGASILVAKAGDSANQDDSTDVSPRVNGYSRVVGKQEMVTNIRMSMRFPSF